MPKIPRRFQNAIYCSAVLLLGWLVYSNTLHNSFIFDDESFIVRNLSIRHLFDLHSHSFIRLTRIVGNWTFALNYAWGGMNVFGFHLVNILLHISCGLLGGWLTYLILSVPKYSNFSISLEKEKIAFWVALLFIVHPVQTMAVDQITQRFVILAAFFYLSSVCFYFKARLSLTKRRSAFYAVISIFFALMGVFTRETFITFPLAILLCEVFFLGGFRRSKGVLLVLMPFILVSGIILIFYHFDILRFIFQASYPSQSHDGDTIGWFNYFLTQSRVLAVYVRLLFVPVGLNFDYDMPISLSFWEPEVIIGFFVIAVFLGLAWKISLRYPLVSFGIFWFFITLLVESSIIPIPYVIAEYRLYLPLFGFCVAIVPCFHRWIKDRRLFTFFMMGVVVIFALLTFQRNEVYRDEVTFWKDTISKSPNKVRPYVNLSTRLIEQGRYKEALNSLNKALELGGSKNIKVLYDLGVVYRLTGQEDKAIEVFEQAIKIEPKSGIYYNLGLIFEHKGDLDKAEENFFKAIYLYDKGYPEMKLGLARIYLRKGELQKAREMYAKIVTHYPLENVAKYSLVQIYLQTKYFPEALKIARKILDSPSNDPQALFVLSKGFAKEGYSGMAMDLINKAYSAK